MGRFQAQRAVHRGFSSLGALGVSLLVFSTAAGAAGFVATLTASQTNFTSATMQLEGTTGANNCYSTGTGSGGTIDTNSSVCTTGSPVPSGSLSASSSSSATTTLQSPGTANASAATVASASCGVAQLSDAQSATRWGGTGPDTALAFNGLTYQSTGPLGSQAITTDGSTAWAETTAKYTNPEGFTVLAWFKTSSAQGAITGFASTQNPTTGTPAQHDRQLWVDPSGKLVWGVYDGATDELTSPSAVNTGSWVFAAASVGAAGTALYVNGTEVASSAPTTAAQSYSGWWSVGYASLAYWPDVPGNYHFNGSIAQLAVIPSQLTSAQVSTLWADNTLSTYTAGVNALSPANSWPLNDSGAVPYTGLVPGVASATTITDASGNGNIGAAQGGIRLGASGPATLGGSAIALDGASGYVQTAHSYANPEGISQVAWFKTASTSGGSIMGFTDAQANTVPGTWDRTIWVDNTGHLVYGVYNGATQELTSPGTYNNGLWHLVIAEIGPAGEQLWVDGTEEASNSSITTAQNYTGYWHLGWGYENFWPDAPTDYYLAGSLSEAAIVPSQLTASQISTLYNAGSNPAFAMDVGQLSPTSYWPFQDSASNVCGTSEVTVQQTVGATNTCIYPAAAGTCAAPSSSYLVTGFGVRAITAPTSSTSVVIKITMQLSAISPTGELGLHELPNIGFGTTKSSALWSAQIAYSSASAQL